MWNLDLFRKSVHMAVLGSGSRGNASVVWSGDDAVLVDCGFSPPQVERRLRRVGVPMESVRAVLVTHEHGDHIGGAPAVARQIGVPVHLTAAARRMGRFGPDVRQGLGSPTRSGCRSRSDRS